MISSPRLRAHILKSVHFRKKQSGVWREKRSFPPFWSLNDVSTCKYEKDTWLGKKVNFVFFFSTFSHPLIMAPLKCMGKSSPLVWKFGNVFALRAKTIRAIVLKIHRTVVKFRAYNFLNRFRIFRVTVCEWWGPKVHAMRSGWGKKRTFVHVAQKRARQSLIKVIPIDSRLRRTFLRFYFSRFLKAVGLVTRRSLYGRIWNK